MTPGGMLSGSAEATSRFKRPPETQRPARPGSVSTLASSRAFTCAASMAGNRPMSNATAPVTCGVAMLVPESVR